jgi:hypothetical protein
MDWQGIALHILQHNTKSPSFERIYRLTSSDIDLKLQCDVLAEHLWLFKFLNQHASAFGNDTLRR